MNSTWKLHMKKIINMQHPFLNLLVLLSLSTQINKCALSVVGLFVTYISNSDN